MTNTSGLSRRTLAKGAAWATPVITLAATAPATAASPQPGLQGWVNLATQCTGSWSRTQSLTIDGRGTYPDRGLWVFNTTPSTNITNASITFYFASSSLIWSAAAGNSGWSTPVVDSSAPNQQGYTAYTTNYSGAWNSRPGPPPYSYAEGQPHFTSSSFSGCNDITAHAYRSVTVNGVVVAFMRSVTLYVGRGRQAPQPDAARADRAAAASSATTTPEPSSERAGVEASGQSEASESTSAPTSTTSESSRETAVPQTSAAAARI